MRILSFVGLAVAFMLFLQLSLVHGILATHPSALTATSTNTARSRKNLAVVSAISEETAKSQTKPLSNLKASIKKVGPILAASFCAAAIMYPLDLVRALQMANANSGVKLTTFQLLENFKNVHGVSGFFTQGLLPELARSTWMRFLKFSLFPVVHFGLTGITESKGTPKTKAIAAVFAAIPEALSIMPLELAKISLQLDTTNRFKNNMFSAMGALFKERGANAFLIGFVGVQYRQAAWSAVYFASVNEFEKLVNKALAAVDPKLLESSSAKMFSQLFSGFLAGVSGAFINTPGDTIRTNIQKAALSGSAAVPGFITVGRDIVQKRGFGALYAGLSMKSLHLGGGGALMAFLIPFFKGVFDKL